MSEIRRPPPELCIPVKEDVEMLKRIQLDSDTLSVVYAGTVASGAGYRDIYLVYTKEAMLHIIMIRRLCPSERELAGEEIREEL